MAGNNPGTVPSSGATTGFARWESGTKNQNMGMMGVPIRKPFVKDYYMNALPQICSAATLTVSVHGDIADPLEYIEVYGEDEEYLGKLFAGNLTYMYEGQRPYDANTDLWDCDGPYDPAISTTAANVRLADPHMPGGTWPKVKGWRGGVNAQPGVYGSEDTKCVKWQKGGDRNPSLQHSESMPYVDSIAIPAEKMMGFTADQQMKLTFRTWRNGAVANVFTGTGGGGVTGNCFHSKGVNSCGTGVACDGCDLDGKVLFRSIKIKFSTAACFTKKLATDKMERFQEGLHTTQPLNVTLSFAVPTGTTGMPGGDAALAVTVGADIFGRESFISVYTKAGVKLGDLFREESSASLVSRTSGDLMLQTTSFGATDAPIPFRTATDCDTTSPVTKTDYCTPADTQWNMGESFVNYTDTILIPRAQVQDLQVNGKIELVLSSDVPGNAFSPSSGGAARISPITLSFPLLHCFQKAIKRGPHFGIYLERPRHYYFMEKGFPVPAGDVTIFFAAHWNRHVRYVTRHVGPAAATAANAFDGLQDGLSVTRVDKDTVSEMGTVWVYKDQNGVDCCPAVYRPEFAGKRFPIPLASNCIGGACTDPDLDSSDLCTHDKPCATSALASATSTTATTVIVLDANAATTDGIYIGLKIVFSAKIDGSTIVAGSGYGCPPSLVNVACTFDKGDGTNVGAILGTHNCAYSTDANGVVTAIAMTIAPLGFYESAPRILPAAGTTCTKFDYTTALLTTAVAAADVGVSNAKVIIAYTGASRTATLGTALAGVGIPTNTNVGYRITGEGVSTYPKNTLNGGTTTGSVVVPLSSDASCQTRYVASGFIEALDATAVYARLDSAMASVSNSAYKDMSIEVLYRTIWETKTINAYTGSVSVTIANVPGSLATFTSIVAGGSMFNAPACGADDCYLRPNEAAVKGLMIDIDIDGDTETGDDIYTTMITNVVYNTPTGGYVTISFTQIAKMPIDGVSTAKINTRVVTLNSALSLTGTSTPLDRSTPTYSQLETGTRQFATAIPISEGAVLLNPNTVEKNDGFQDRFYNDHILKITHVASGITYTYTIVDYCIANALPTGVSTIAGGFGAGGIAGSNQVAVLDRLLVEAVAVGDRYVIYRPYRIYQRLSPTGSETCLVGSDLRVTYTVGFAATIANEPGQMQDIVSNWDSSTGNAVSIATTGTVGMQTGQPSTRDVRSWMIKLTGEGYFFELYRQQGVGAFVTTNLGATLATAGTAATVTSTAGMSVGMFLLLVDSTAPGTTEIVKISAVKSGTTLTIARAQMGTTASVATFTAATVVTPTGNNVDGSGYDDMAAFGGTSRPTIVTNDAYTGLNITIIDGMGAGQSRVIAGYHGASRTVYVSKAWDIIPDGTSRYEIWYAALIGGAEKPVGANAATMPTMAIATFPRPIRAGYLWRVEWFDCANAIVNTEGAAGSQNSNSLPQCPGSLRMVIPKQGPVTDYSLTSMLNRAQAQIFYTMREVDITRQEYPEMIKEHKLWPHGYNYMKLMAGEDGELLGNVFLKDYTQYSTMSYYTDTITIPKERFANYVRQNGDFSFTLATPPGKGNIELRSIVISYPVTKVADASTYDASQFPETTALSSHGPPPFFPRSVAWTGSDETTRVSATHPRFKTHSYTSTCGNGRQDGEEYCDDGNEVDGDGCSSSCTQELGFMCKTPFQDQPSMCTEGAQGARIADPAVGCKYYACEVKNPLVITGYVGAGVACSGKVLPAITPTAVSAIFATTATSLTMSTTFIALGVNVGHYLMITEGSTTETVLVTAIAGADLTVVRAQLGSSDPGVSFTTAAIVTQALIRQPPECKDSNNKQGSCTLCVGWGNDPVNNGIDSYAGRTAYRR